MISVTGPTRRIAGVALILLLSASVPARAATPDQVENALVRARKFLYSRMHGDNWEVVPKRDDKLGEAGQASVSSGQWGGPTAIAVYALLADGEDPNDPKLASAIKWLKTADIIGAYALSMRCQVWLLLPRTTETRRLADEDRERLSHCFDTTGRGKFLYTYRITKHEPNMVDHSVSQFGVLSMWACVQMGIEVPTSYWQDVDARWKYDQQPDGGWLYAEHPNGRDHPGTQASMTAAGVATLFITQDYVNPSAGIRCVGNVNNEHIEKGLAWMAAHANEWAPSVSWGGFWLPGYTLYGVERIGVASGLKYFGNVDWYQNGAEWCVTHQGRDGSWGGANDIPNTSFCMLFLARGRAPVLINKIEYTNSEGPGKGKLGRWDQRPRDVANFVHWMSLQTERDINWQVTNLRVSEEELHDAPFLYLSGNEAFSLADDEIAKLKQFTLHGGMILFNSDCGTAEGAAANPFVDSVIQLGKKMFPESEFRELPPTHPIFTQEQYPPSRWKQQVVLKGLSNGVRELMILMPNDPAKAWQLQETTGDGRVEAYQSTDDIILYGTDKQNLHVKGQAFLIRPNPKIIATKTAKIGRVKYNGNWDPEPGGWDRLAALMHNLAKVDITAKPVEIGKNLLGGYNVLHVTGATPFTFTPEQRQQLTEYVQNGGTLVFDAAGGSSEFATSAEKLLQQMYPGGLKEPLPPSDPLFKTGVPKTQIRYRHFTTTVLGRLRTPQLKAIKVGGRNAVYYSREDLSAGLVGEPVDGIVGYDPDSSSEIMSAIILKSLGK
jgi:hypothetical protein